MTTPDDVHHPGEKAVLGVVATVGGAMLIWGIQRGDSTAFFIFLMMLFWVVAKLTGWWNPWGAVLAGSLGWIAYGLFH